MEILRTAKEMQTWSEKTRGAGHSLGFVPTMGALHEGHLSLIRLARAQSDHVVVSIFVNPTQFEDQEDLKKYPRDTDRDRDLCDAEGVDAVFLPTAEEMYPDGYKIDLKAPALANCLCGATRPGHFDGVVTIVQKLFKIVQPTRAFFGEKDYQQLAIIRWLVRDQNIPIEIVGAPIVREKDGLAMSSRNRRLSAEERKQALVLSRSVKAMQTLVAGGEHDVGKLLKLAKDVLHSQAGIKLDYAEIRDAVTLQTIEKVDRPALYAVAAFVGPVRLIDNCVLIRGR